MSTHIIHFTAPINSSTCGQLIRKGTDALTQDATKLIVRLATLGGDCAYGFTAYNFLTSLPIPVHTHNLGTVESMGNILFLAGERRTASRRSKFLFHPFFWNLHGAIDHARVSEYSMTLDHDLELYAQIVQERTAGASEALDVPNYLKGAPRILDPQEALATGLIDAVDDESLPGECVHWVIPA